MLAAFNAWPPLVPSAYSDRILLSFAFDISRSIPCYYFCCTQSETFGAL